MSSPNAESNPSPAATSELPVAELTSPASIWRSPWVWSIVAAALMLALILVVASVRSRGTVITIIFEQGFGIKAGDALRHRGIEVGQVISVDLRPDGEGVRVRVALEPNAGNLAREGSQFWIVRPQVGLSGIRGLETIVGANYLGVLPAASDAPRSTLFQGRESPLRFLEWDVIEISIHFLDGHGLDVGDPVKYRGISVGEVTQVKLDDDLRGILVSVRLLQNADALARAGSQFWIERPDVSLAGVRGLDTVVGGRYLGVLPGPEDAEQQGFFEGLVEAPDTGERSPGGLDVVLQASERSGLKRGVPVFYRGIRVGHISTVGLASDAVAVEAHAYIEPAYKNLVRENTEFWNVSGIDLRFGLTGVELDADALSSIAVGGVAMATPDEAGAAVSTGFVFEFSDQAPDDWLEWQPRIAVGSAQLPPGTPLPHLLRATAHWKTKSLGIRRSHDRSGWVLPVDGKEVGALFELLEIPEEALDDELRLEVAGSELVVKADMLDVQGPLVRCRTDSRIGDPDRQWASRRTRSPQSLEAILLVAGGPETTIPVAETRLTEEDGIWLVDPSLSIPEEWQGAVALSVADGAVIGFVRVVKGRVQIVPWSW